MTAEFSRKKSVPNPDDVAYRASIATGRKNLDPFSVLDEEGDLRTSFDIPDGAFGNKAMDRAVIKVERTLADGNTSESLAHIGHYDSDSQQWKFYPEMIDYENWGALGNFFDEEIYLKKLDEAENKHEPAGTHYLIRHPLTTLARQETGKLLAKTGVAERIIREFANADDPIYTFDEATTVYLSLPRAMINTEEKAKYNAAHNGYIPLGLHYIGLRQAKGDTIKRVDCLYDIARLPNDGSEWQPNGDFIKRAEWGYLSQVPTLLTGYKKINSQFSMLENVVVKT
jgi:hypothetical protein